ncbi:3'-5' exonuclease family protein [Undibacterium curvum]|uniref:3'-5' exonuclease family protein n=1 Tax=Undibacterium curvum TaxID=2762294 RepID=UPI001C9A5E48|nr:3'-5' exonuclease family protein [Undibacterium curvum]
MSKFATPLAFVDLETTGTIATRDRITEIAIIRFDGAHIERWSQLINPETQIPPFVEQLTGISNAMVADQPLFAELAPQILAQLQGHMLVAHNARFDYGFLKNEFRRLEMSYRAPVLCTLKLSRKLFPQFVKHNLDSIIERHQIVVGERHRAMTDADALLQFWQALQQVPGEAALLAAVKELSSRPALPPHLDADIVDQLPKGYGVYLFYGENRLPIYVGKSNTLRQRVLSHFSADHALAKEMNISQQVRDIEWIECAGEIDALITEARLIKEKQPTLNRQLRRNSEFCSWRLSDLGSGLLQPQLVYGRDLDLGRQEQLYGLFKSGASAREFLLQAVKQYQLCAATLGLEKGGNGKPCFARQLKQCKGACVGQESALQHNLRLIEALAEMKLKAWPFAGPALLQEAGVYHVIEAWCYLGRAETLDQVPDLLASGKPRFDRDTYRILVKYLNRMQAYSA